MRGIGVVDVLLYVFIFLLSMFALIITGLGGLTEGVTTISIRASDSVHEDIVLRSVLEGLSLMELPEYEISQAERIAMVSSYVEYDGFVSFVSLRESIFPSNFELVTIIPRYEGSDPNLLSYYLENTSDIAFTYGFERDGLLSKTIQMPGYRNAEPTAHTITIETFDRGFVQ